MMVDDLPSQINEVCVFYLMVVQKEQRAEEDQERCFFFCLVSRPRVLIVRASRGSLVVVEFDWLNGNRLWGVVRPIVEHSNG